MRKCLPERRALALIHDSWRRKCALRTLESAQGGVRKISCRIARDEIKDPVAARICSSRKRRPCHWSLRRIGGPQPRIRAGLPNACEVREFSALKHGLDDGGFQSVESYDDRLLTQMSGLRSRSIFRGASSRCRRGAAHLVHDLDEGTHDFVPEHQQNADYPGNTGGHGHHLVGASVES